MVQLFPGLQRALHQLRWKLTFNYMAVTVGTLLVAVLIVAALFFRTILVPNEVLTRRLWFEAADKNMIPAMRQVLSQSPPNMQILEMMLESPNATINDKEIFRLGHMELWVRTSARLEIIIIAGDGTFLATSNRASLPGAQVGRPLESRAIAGMSPSVQAALLDKEGPLQMALAGDKDRDHLFVEIEPNEKFLMALPVLGTGADAGKVLGVIVANFESLPTADDISSHALLVAGRSLLLFLLGAGILAAVFGAVTASGMARRFRRLSNAAAAWSQGDFAEFIDDPRGDEISQLALHLNQMAERLQTLLRKRQEMAVTEERNRLARELHDSAKQQAFAASAQLAAATALAEQDAQAAKPHLREAAKLVDKVRQELTSLILELRPVDLGEGGLVEAVRAYAIDWAHQNDIEVDVKVRGEGRRLPLAVEKTLFRITQEALANTARHSRAQCAEISLVYERNGISLTLADDGRGFDTRQVQAGLGLRSMRERVAQIGGSLLIESREGEGTRISLTGLLDPSLSGI